jgi:hypothetical protein
LERAVGAEFEAYDWAERVETVLAENFVRCHWPARFLIAAPLTTEGADA